MAERLQLRVFISSVQKELASERLLIAISGIHFESLA